MSRMQEAAAWLRMLSIDVGQAVGDEGIRRFWDAQRAAAGFPEALGRRRDAAVAGALPTLAALRFGTHLPVVAALRDALPARRRCGGD